MILIGGYFQPLHIIFFTFYTGTSFINSNVYLTLRPSIGFYFGNNELMSAHIGLTHIFQCDDASKQPFGYINLGMGLKLF